MAGPFPDHILDAVGACTRTLAEQPDADAALAESTAASLGSLRAFADRLALKRRHHDAAVHQRHRPTEGLAPQAFDALEHARLDALGVRWLAGVANNLLAHPGVEPDGVRWLAFEILSGRPAPPSKTQLVADARRVLPRPMIDHLARLAADVESQTRYAPAAAAWARDASASLVRLPAQASPFPLPTRPTRTRQVPKRGDPGATAAPLTKRSAEPQPDSDGTAAGNAAATGRALDVDRQAYRAYTTAYDRVIDAATLATREELAELQGKLEAELAAARPMIRRLAKKLLRVIMAQQTRQWRFDLDEGVVDGSRLGALVASRGGVRPFKEESESPFPGTVVSLLIDHSGSMRGRPMLIAALTVEIFVRVLERCGVRCEVLGFTTRDWDGGEPAREWAANGYPEGPGRLNALEHIILKEADVPWRRARISLGLLLRDEMLKENIDGEAVIWAHNRLRARSESRRVLVVVSDGTPMDEATLAANGHEFLERHLQAVVKTIESRSPVQVAAIGIGHDVSLFYANATRVARIDDLGPALSTKLIALLGATPARRT